MIMLISIFVLNFLLARVFVHGGHELWKWELLSNE